MTTPLSLAPGLREEWRMVNGVRLHCVEAGEMGQPVVLFLHGFPEFWRAWERQLLPLARAGYHVVAPDMRGYNLSDKPAGLDAYRLEELVGDIAALIDALGGQVYVAAHDWGGIIAWHHAQQYPQQVRKLVSVNAPHPGRMREVLRKPAQWVRSWYVALFQLPGLGEQLLRPGNAAATFGNHRSGAYTPAELADYERAWSEPGAATAMINYYRAAVQRSRPQLFEATPLPMPVMVIWGEQDQALLPDFAEGLERWIPDLRVVRLPHASHWVPHEEAVRVTQLLLDFFA